MNEMIEAIRAAIADGATAEQKVAGAHACRTIATALEAEIGKPIALAGMPTASPLAGISPDHALDLLIARLSAMVPKEPTGGSETIPTRGTPTLAAPLRIAFVQPPARAIPAPRRKP
jgi:hypothetical protein